MILSTDDPDNHVIGAIGRGYEGRAATAAGSGHIPTAGNIDTRRIGGSNAESGQHSVAIVVGAERDKGALFGSVGDGCLENSAGGNLS